MSPLRAKRKAAGLSAQELAARVGMNWQRLARIERGYLKLRVEDVLVLAAELGCEVSELMPPVVRKTPVAS